MRSFVKLYVVLVSLLLVHILGTCQPCTGWTIKDVDVSNKRIIRAYYDNDLFAGTNRYYTQGLTVDYIDPRFKELFLSRLLLFRLRNRARTYYGLSVKHSTYTPENIDLEEIALGDRPYTRTFSLSHFLISNDSDKKRRLTTNLELGLMGPVASFGLVRGGSFSADGPKGWDNQISNNIIINYTAIFEQGFLSVPGIDFLAYGRAKLGTEQTHAALGAKLRFGRLNPYFYTLHFTPRSMLGKRDIHDIQVFGHVNAELQAIAYNATLQGGLFFDNSPYTIPGPQLKRLLPRGSAGISFIIKRLGFGYEHFLQFKEFIGANRHSWGRIHVIVWL